MYSAESVDHGIEQAADHRVSSRLCTEAHQRTLRVGSEEDALVIGRLVNAGGGMARVLHRRKAVKQLAKYHEWGPLGFQATRRRVLCRT